MSRVSIRPATADDCPLILDFIRELALYEKAPEAVVATEAQLREYGFGDRPAFEAIIAEIDGEPAGMALFHARFSTWLGTPTLFLEDMRGSTVTTVKPSTVACAIMMRSHGSRCGPGSAAAARAWSREIAKTEIPSRCN